MITGYRGRFAPTPSGELHFGSLVAALASYLDAKANNGIWLVRIDDVDTTRARPEAITSILNCLASHGLHSDEPVYYQSHHYDTYTQALSGLVSADQAFYCNCTRARLKTLDHVYDGHCINKPPADTDNCAVRLLPDAPVLSLQDRLQGEQQWQQPRSPNPVLRRRDRCFGYPLSMVLDDQAQQITHVVRGLDLLGETAPQLHLQQLLGLATPSYAHIGTAVLSDGKKLSKQNHAPIIDRHCPMTNLHAALQWLNQPPVNPQLTTPEQLLAQATQQWQLARCPITTKVAPAQFCS